MGHEVELATDGIETLEKLCRSSFQLVLMDLQMPGLSGLQVTEEYRAQGGKIPIIALTANADLAERDACLSAGMQVYLTKPLSLSRLRSTLSRLAENQATNKDEPPSDASRAEALGEIGVDGP
jgi:two-component system, sensor histidine kinase and response regulator